MQPNSHSPPDTYAVAVFPIVWIDIAFGVRRLGLATYCGPSTRYVDASVKDSADSPHF